MEALLAQLREEVSALPGNELVMLLHNTAGQLAVTEPSWARSTKLLDELLNHAGLLVESDGFCQELAHRYEAFTMSFLRFHNKLYWVQSSSKAIQSHDCDASQVCGDL